MTARTNTPPAAVSPLWATLPDRIKAMSIKAGAEIVVHENAFGLIYCGDLISTGSNVNEIDNFLQGCLCGQDRFDVPALVDELVKSEQIVLALTAGMTDEQKTQAAAALVALGFPEDATGRHPQRQQLIIETREMMSYAEVMQ